MEENERTRKISAVDIFRWHFDAIFPDVTTKSISYFYESHFTGLNPFPIIQTGSIEIVVISTVPSPKARKKDVHIPIMTKTMPTKETGRPREGEKKAHTHTHTHTHKQTCMLTGNWTSNTLCSIQQLFRQAFNNKQPKRYQKRVIHQIWGECAMLSLVIRKSFVQMTVFYVICCCCSCLWIKY